MHHVTVATGHSSVSVQANSGPGGYTAVARFRAGTVFGPCRPVGAHLTVAVPLLGCHAVASGLPDNAVVALASAHLGTAAAGYRAGTVIAPCGPGGTSLSVAGGSFCEGSLATFFSLFTVDARSGVDAGSGTASLVARSPFVPFAPEWTILRNMLLFN